MTLPDDADEVDARRALWELEGKAYPREMDLTNCDLTSATWDDETAFPPPRPDEPLATHWIDLGEELGRWVTDGSHGVREGHPMPPRMTGSDWLDADAHKRRVLSDLLRGPRHSQPQDGFGIPAQPDGERAARSLRLLDGLQVLWTHTDSIPAIAIGLDAEYRPVTFVVGWKNK